MFNPSILEDDVKLALAECLKDFVKRKVCYFIVTNSERSINIVPTNIYNEQINIDNNDPRWAAIAVIMVKYGFEWAGNWKENPDYSLYQI